MNVERKEVYSKKSVKHVYSVLCDTIESMKSLTLHKIMDETEATIK